MFLRRLSQVLPVDCRPVIDAHAGSRGPWFREVERLGRDWVGRVRSRVQYCLDNTKTWYHPSARYDEASSRARHFARVRLSKYHPYECQLYVVRKYQRGPGRPRTRRDNRAAPKYCSVEHRALWVTAGISARRRRERVRRSTAHGAAAARGRCHPHGGATLAGQREANALSVPVLLAQVVGWQRERAAAASPPA